MLDKGGGTVEILRAEKVCYSYQTKYQKVNAVKGVSCSFNAGFFYAIVGESGSGKSTLLSLLAGLDLPESGEIYIKNQRIDTIDRDAYRLNHVSVVYQEFHLFPLLTALENVMLPMQFKNIPKKEAKQRAKEILQHVGLLDSIYMQFPQMMSGGEQQRVAIARAVASGGEILLADEPTGNLDTENEKNIIALLKHLAHEDGYAVIVITHNLGVADEADFVLSMSDGEMKRIR